MSAGRRAPGAWSDSGPARSRGSWRRAWPHWVWPDAGRRDGATATPPRAARWGWSSRWVGSALDNAAAEAFNPTIKVEYIHRQRFRTRAEARLKISTWIVDFDNVRRRHSARTRPKPCPCHGRTYVFHGNGAANGAVRQPGAKLVDVARRAGFSTGTVSTVLNRPGSVPEATRVTVEQAIADLGYVRGIRIRETAAHWRRTGFATWLFQPAATGWYPKKAPQPPRPVLVLAQPWPGVPARGRNANSRADSCWLPIAPGLTPHGLRHSHKIRMEELGTPPKLMDERMGHEDGSVQARCTRVTADMRQRLMIGLTESWGAALDARRQISPDSPLAVLAGLLAVRRSETRRQLPPSGYQSRR